MSALTLLRELLAEIERLPVVPDGPIGQVGDQKAQQGFQKQSRDVAWDPVVPQGHTGYSWGTSAPPAAAGATGAPKNFSLRSPVEMVARSTAASQPEVKQETKAANQPQQPKQQQQQPKQENQRKQKGAPQQQQQQQQQKKGGEQGKGQQKQQAKGGGKQEQAAPATPRDAYYQLDIRVGKIVKAWKHPDADRLYVEQIDLGEEEPRQVCSGLVEHIPLDQFQGSDALVIVNLKPAEMKKVMSYGMVLAAKTDKKIELVKPPAGTPVGARVYLQGDDDVEWPAPLPEIDARNKKSAWAVVAPLLKTNAEGNATLDGKPLVLKNGPTRSSIPNGVVS
jgi:aminoacyl tRNA synthase complex-interacting multifunctional protein 1